jgi:ubiquilin
MMPPQMYGGYPRPAFPFPYGLGVGYPGMPATGMMGMAPGQRQQQPAQGPPQNPPEVVFSSQLQQLRDMGFTDDATSLRALQATNGNVNAAVERLLSGR